MIWNHHRIQIWNQNQHPLVHSLDDFQYSNPAIPGSGSTMQSALDYIVAVLYPNSKAAVATPAALPLVGNTINDYRIVQDDGDGKAAGYRWEQREGEATPSWHKIYDLDWGTDSILQAWQNRTQDLFVIRHGYDDIDQTGAAIAGLFAGQHIFGGKSANTNMTLSANSGDGVGANTGYVQVTDNFRPTVDSTLSLGTTAERWLKVWTDEITVGTMTLSAGSIADSSGLISFGATNLATSGEIEVGATLTLASGQISDGSGAISFLANDLTTTGTVTADNFIGVGSASQFAAGTQVANFTFTNGNIASASATVNFNALNLTTTGIVTAAQLLVDSLSVDGNTLSVTALNTNLILAANGTGVIAISSALTTSSNVTMTSATLLLTSSTLTVTGQLNIDNLQLDGNTLASTNTNGNIVLTPNGTGQIEASATLYPSPDATLSLGKAGQRWVDVWLSGALKDGTNIFTISDLMTLRSANFRDAARTLPAQSGDTLFFDGSQWLASVPDSEISHASLSGLTTGDAGHTQFALLAGRAGGQSLNGGTASGENLTLDSTAHATKGAIRIGSTLRPVADAAYSAGWTGTDLGSASFRINDLYMAGEIKSLRAENLGVLPSSSSQKVGRVFYYTGDENLYVDTGTTIKQVGGSRFYVDTVWNGTDTTKNVTVSGTDARLAVWQLKDNTNDFEVIYCSIKATSATNVLITLGSPLPAGSYRLVGV